VTDIPPTARGGLGTPQTGEDKLVTAVVAPPADLLAEVDDNGKPAKAPVPFPLANGDGDNTVVLSVGMPRW